MLTNLVVMAIAVIIMSGIMYMGSNFGSGGIDQTKAAKVVGEISTLGTNVQTFKTTTESSDYEGLTTQAAVDAGIIKASKTAQVKDDGNGGLYVDVDNSDSYDAGEGVDSESGLVAGDVVVVSEAVKGAFYKVESRDGTPELDHLTVAVTSDSGFVSDSLKKAMEAAYGKFGNYFYTGGESTDGQGTIVFE